MSLFNNRNEIVTPSNTILLGGRYQEGGVLRHYLGYFTQAVGTPGAAFKPRVDMEEFHMGEGVEDEAAYQRTLRANHRPFGFHAAGTEMAPQGNAILVPFPAVPMTRPGEIQIIPLDEKNRLLHKYSRAVELHGAESGTVSLSKAEVIKDFAGGLYDVVYSPYAGYINDAVHAVAKDKKPVPNPELYRQLDLLYPRWSWLVFCFNRADEPRAGGALVTYVSQYPDLLFLPGLVGHSGSLEKNMVNTNHTIVLGAQSFLEGANSAPIVPDEWMRTNAPWLPKQVIGSKISRFMPQGDYVFDAREVEKGIFNGLRDQPPGWPRVFGPNSLEGEPLMFGDKRWSGANPEHFL